MDKRKSVLFYKNLKKWGGIKWNEESVWKLNVWIHGDKEHITVKNYTKVKQKETTKTMKKFVWTKLREGDNEN